MSSRLARHSFAASLPGAGPGASDARRSRNEALESLFAGGFPYSRKLSAHTSCINALTFSSGDGRFLASGGDDLQIRLWDFHQENITAPSCTLLGSRGIIFTMKFSATNQYLYSGGVDTVVRKYDIGSMTALEVASVSGRSPKQTFDGHKENIRSITCHPVQDEIFMSASEDGSIRRHDCRVSHSQARAQDTIQQMAEFTGIQYHPFLEHTFVTCDSRGEVYLRDERMAFGPLTKRTNEGIVQRYNTKLTRKSVGHLSNPESSSVVFDREGSKLAVKMLHYLPTIYSLSDPNPLAVCSGKNLPDGTPNPPGKRTYSNSCTMKHGSFGGPGLPTDEFYGAGSDDFRGYVWKIPPLPELAERREEISPFDWDIPGHQDRIAFSEGLNATKHVPLELSTPLCRLTGKYDRNRHNSIVNTALFHPNFLHIVTSGVEKHIVLHSPTPTSPCTQDLQKSLSEVRELSQDPDEDRIAYLRGLILERPDVLSGEEEAERTTLSMFDHILRTEGEGNVFEIRKWRDSSESDEEDEEDSSSESPGAWNEI